MLPIFNRNQPVWLSLALAVAAAVPVVGQGTPAAPAARPSQTNISGFWIIQDPGSGSWDEFWNNVPKPVLHPWVVHENKERVASLMSGNVTNVDRGGPTCPVGNFTLMMASSPPLMIVQGRHEITIASESNRARFIYLGAAPPEPDPKSLERSGFGRSLGHWEGDTLVVETDGFPARVCDSRNPTLLVPGGGRALPTTRLTERFQLIDRQNLTITFIWNDPAIYGQPHSYTYRFKLLPDSFPLEPGQGGGGGGGGAPQAAPAVETSYGRAKVTADQVPDGVLPGP